MPLVKMTDLFAAHDDTSFAVGAFNVSNMEMALGAIQAAEELQTPLILQIAEGRLRYSPLDLLGSVMLAAALKCKVPTAVHLDHGSTLETIKLALELGFTSVMFDGSKYPLEENISRTRAIGTAHGNYTVQPKLRIDRLKEIFDVVQTPLVLHGGTGLTDADFRNCIANGIKKINIATASYDNSARKIREVCAASPNAKFFDFSDAIVQGTRENVKRHMKIFNPERR